MNKFKNDTFDNQSKRYNNKYINWFISQRCAVDLLEHKIFPNAKEITESFAGFNATQYIDCDWSDKNTNVVCVGDGTTPRTAALFAYKTAWNCVSVDPQLKKTSYPIDRLTLYQNLIQDIKLEFDHPTIVVCVHSHAKLQLCLNSIKAPIRHIIAIPCCVKLDLGYKPDDEYIDEDIWSPCNYVKIWRNV